MVRKRKRLVVFVALLMAVFAFIAQCTRPPERRTLSSTFGKTPASVTARSTAAPPERSRREDVLDDSTFRPVTATLRSAGDGPDVRKTDDGFLVSLQSEQAVGWPTLPAVYDGMLLFGGGPGAQQSRFFALDAHSGALRWSVDLADPQVLAPACDDGVCALTTESCSLYVLDAHSGETLWAKFLAGSLHGAPTIASGRVFATYPRTRGALDPFPRNPTPAQLRKYYARVSRQQHAVLAAFDLRSGKTDWQQWLDQDTSAAPIVANGRVHVAIPNVLVAFATSGGGVVSSRRVDSYEFGLSLPWGRDVLWSPTSVESVDSGTGADVWTIPVDQPTEPIRVGDAIIVGSRAGDILKIDAVTGDVIRRWSAGSAVLAQPIANDGWIYAATQQGIVAIDTGDTSITGWTQWGGNAQRSLASIERRSARPASSEAVADMARHDEADALKRIDAAASPSPTPESWELP